MLLRLKSRKTISTLLKSIYRFEAADNDEKFDDAVKKIKKDDKEKSKK